MDQPPKPWQNEGIKPGQDWDYEIRNALNQAAVIVIFLSKSSIDKKGYVQREYRLALDIANERPPGNRNLVPVLLEPCDVPDIRVDTISLKHIQWHLQYKSTINELISLLSDILVPRSLHDLPQQPPKSTLSETQALFEIIKSIYPFEKEQTSRVNDESHENWIIKSINYLISKEIEELRKIFFPHNFTNSRVKLKTATNALLQIQDRFVATGCAMIIGSILNYTGLEKNDIKTFRLLLNHKILDVRFIASLVLIKNEHNKTNCHDIIRKYNDLTYYLAGIHVFIERLFYFSPELLPILIENAPIIAWKAFSNEPHLAGIDMHILSVKHKTINCEKLIKSSDWNVREIGATILSSNYDITFPEKLELLKDKEPRIRFRTLQGILHSHHDKYIDLLKYTLITNPHTESEDRIYLVNSINDGQCVLIQLSDKKSSTPKKSSMSGGSLDFHFAEYLDEVDFTLNGLILIGDYRGNETQIADLFKRKIPLWILESVFYHSKILKKYKGISS